MAPNVVLLTIDSLRNDYSTPELMPSLNQQAANGIRCAQAYANGYSTPISFPTILTSSYADHYGGHGYMTEDRPFLAKHLRRAGYQTAAFHTNPHLRVEKNYDVGFDEFNDFEDKAGEISQFRYRITQHLDNDSWPYKILKRGYHFLRTQSGTADYTPAPVLNDLALDWLDKKRDSGKPFFLWLHYMDVHYPFFPPSEYLDRYISTSRAITVNGKMHESGEELTNKGVEDLRALYRGEVRYMDHHLGEIIESFRDRGVYEETVFAITSDHGELFGEYGLFGHPPSCYEESLHVPLVIFGPGIPRGEIVEPAIALTDLAPTVADLAGVEMAEDWEGKSLLPCIKSGELTERSSFVTGSLNAVIANQTGNWRLIHWQAHDCPTDRTREWELLRLPGGESESLENHEELIERLCSDLQNFEERARAWESVDGPEVDEATQDQLDALGYQ